MHVLACDFSDYRRLVVDDAGRLRSIDSPEGQVSYTYDLSGRRETMTTSAGTTTYGYDPVGRVASLTDPGGAESILSWRPDGRLGQVARPNGITTSYTYDGAGRLSQVGHVGQSGPVEDFAYTHDPAGRRTSVSSNAGQADYSYDDLDRLLAVDTSSGDESFTYDGAGNIVTHTTSAGTTTHLYDAAGQRVQSDGPAGLVEHTYDADGNLTSSSDGTAYTWDSAGMLTAATIDGVDTDYRYDGLGRRVRIDGVAQLWDPATDTLVAQGTQSFTHTPAGLLSAHDDSATSYPLADALGSIRINTDSDGATIGTSAYTAYGEPTGPTGELGAFGYTGQQTDPNGLVHLRARQYNPQMASFVSPDAVQPNAGGTQGWNPYSYARSSPIDNADPTGHTPSPAVPAVGPAPIPTTPGASALTTVGTRTSPILFEGHILSADGVTKIGGGAGSSPSTIAVGEKQQARPGGGSSLIAYGAITTAAVMGSWWFTRIGVYNSVTFAVGVRLLETPPSPRADLALQNRLDREEHLLHAQRLRPGPCSVDPNQLANRATVLNNAQESEAGWKGGRTTAVLRSHFIAQPWLCFDFVGSGAKKQFGDGAPGVYAMLEPHEAPVYLPFQHAEVVVLAWSSIFAMVPIAIGMSGPACATDDTQSPLPEGYQCKDVLWASGARPWGPKSWYWPGSLPYIIAGGWFW